MRAVSDRFLAALGGPKAIATEITCTPPGGDPVPLLWDPEQDSGSISMGAGSRVRYTASLSVASVVGGDTFDVISTPGAVFRIRQGIAFSPDDIEWVDLFAGETAKPEVGVFDGGIRLSLVDQWQRLDACRFMEPYAPISGVRGGRIASAVGDAIPGTTIVVHDGGGIMPGGGLWDKDRTKFITDVATDGDLDVGFDAAGAFIVQTAPTIDPLSVAWSLTTGRSGVIIDASRGRDLSRLYNAVVVMPTEEGQTWTAQTVELADTSHPLHRSKIGRRPFYHSSPTIMTAGAAISTARGTLRRLLGVRETRTYEALSNPALEYGDTVTIDHPATDTDPGLTGAEMVVGWRHDMRTWEMQIDTRTDDQPAMEES